MALNIMNRGALIVFEGCDRCGKSTQSSLLVKYLRLQNVPVEHMAFPDRRTQSGSLIHEYLTNKEDMPDECIHLLFTLNRWEVQNKMKSLITSGVTLVVDRYSYSGVAYSVAKGMNMDWCKAPERGLIRPDLVFYLSTDIDTLAQRQSFGDERYEKQEFQGRVAHAFEEICSMEKGYWVKVNANQNCDVVQSEIQKETDKLIQNVGQLDLKLLW